MGRGPELTGDIRTRLFEQAVDGPITAPEGTRLNDHLAEMHGCNEDYVRQLLNELENQGAITVERNGAIAVGYDIHPAHIRRSDTPWTPTEMLEALVRAADSTGTLSRDRYTFFPPQGRPPAEVIEFTFRSWDRALGAAGLPKAPDPAGP